MPKTGKDMQRDNTIDTAKSFKSHKDVRCTFTPLKLSQLWKRIFADFLSSQNCNKLEE